MEQENKEGRLIDSMVSSLKIQETLDKKSVRRIRIMPEIKKNYDFVAKDETSAEANYFCDGFVEGAEWRINSVWHKISEKPNFSNLPILLQHKNEEIHFIDAIPASWLYFQKYYTGWAYIKDLIPDKED